MPAAPAQRRVRREVSPDQVISSALALFLERGFAATRMEDVASKAGISKGAIYLHFPNKNALFNEVVRSGVLSRLEQAEATVASHQGSARELLDALMHGVLLEFWDSASSGIPKLIIAEAQAFPELARDYFHEVSLRTRGLLENILSGGVESGEFRPMDIPNTARVILSALEHQPVLHHSLGVHDPEPLEPVRFVDAMLDLVSTGLLKTTQGDAKQ